MNLASLRNQIPCLQRVTYLNSGSFGPTPQPVVDAQQAVLLEQLRMGGSAPPVSQMLGEINEACRETVAQAVGAEPEEIALTQSTSDGIGIVAAGIDWRPEDEVITSNLEHVSGVLPWRQAAFRYGIKVVNLEDKQGYLTVEDFAAAITPRTRLICLSHIAWNSGAVLPVPEVCALAAKRGIMVLVDGAQSAGQIPLNMHELGCHFYSLPGHKWMMGPVGTGALYVRRDMIPQLYASRAGWASISGDDQGGAISFHTGARRYEAGTIHSPAYAGWRAAIQFVATQGADEMYARIKQLAREARAIFRKVPGCEILGPDDSALWSGLLPMRISGCDPKTLVERLWKEHNIITRWIPKPYALRISLHAFVTVEELKRTAEVISRICC